MERKDVTVKGSTGEIKLTPFALAHISNDLFQSSQGYTPKDHFPLVNYFLLLASVERGLKAAILSKECTKEMKEYLRRKIGHDLPKTHNKFSEYFDVFLTKEDLDILRKVNGRYKEKGFEYFSSDMVVLAMRAFKALPSIGEVKRVAKKVNDFVQSNKYFINS